MPKQPAEPALKEEHPVGFLSELYKQVNRDHNTRFFSLYLGLAILILFFFTVSLAPQIGEKLGLISLRKEGQQSFAADESLQQKLVKPAEEIIEVALHLSKGNSIKHLGTVVKNGYFSTPVEKEDDFTVELLDKENTLLFQTNFTRPDVIYDPPPLEGEISFQSGPIILPEVDFALTLPYFPEAVLLRILNTKGEELAKIPLKNLPKEKHEPKFKTITSHSKKKTSIFSIPEILAQGPRAYLDITFIGDNYTDMGAFHNDVNNFINHLLTYEPFTAKASDILFHYVDNTADLGCGHDAVIVRQVTCNELTVRHELNNAVVPTDIAVVIVNDTQYGGSSNGLAVSYNGPQGPQVFVHELGHNLGRLGEEYVKFTYDGNVQDICGGNLCLSSLCVDWQGMPGVGCFKGATYPNWYRSSNTSIMRSIDAEYFNVISQNIINNNINKLISGKIIGWFFRDDDGDGKYNNDLSTIIKDPSIVCGGYPLSGVSMHYSGASIGDEISNKCDGKYNYAFFETGLIPSGNYIINALVPTGWEVTGVVMPGSPAGWTINSDKSVTGFLDGNRALSIRFGLRVTTQDSDNDGFSDDAEVYLGTDPNKACAVTPTTNDEAVDSWPPDFNDDRKATIVDVLFFGDKMTKKIADDPTLKRYDFDMNGTINIIDVQYMSPYMTKTCTP